jgi:hypothetical protein
MSAFDHNATQYGAVVLPHLPKFSQFKLFLRCISAGLVWLNWKALDGCNLTPRDTGINLRSRGEFWSGFGNSRGLWVLVLLLDIDLLSRSVGWLTLARPQQQPHQCGD